MEGFNYNSSANDKVPEAADDKELDMPLNNDIIRATKCFMMSTKKGTQ